eukprot:PRCOL_00000058-RA
MAAAVATAIAAASGAAFAAGPEERCVSVPMNFFAVLGLRTAMSSASVARCYEERLAAAPAEGLSANALDARLEVLRVVAGILGNGSTRDIYARGLKEGADADGLVQEVPLRLVPGVLSLLQEAGEEEVVLQVGEEAMRGRAGRAIASDVAVCMALARCDLGRVAMGARPPDVVGGCEQLEHAAHLLREHGGTSLAPRLLDAIDTTLAEMKPRNVIELLALPIGEDNRHNRDRGLKGLRDLLWSREGAITAAAAAGAAKTGTSAGPPDLWRFKAAAYAHMTTRELVDIFAATPPSPALTLEELYTAALANVACGFRSREPRLVLEADRLLAEIQAEQARQANQATPASAARAPAGSKGTQVPGDVTLERAMCTLLLGEPAKARNFLQLDVAPDGAPIRRSPAAQFVMSHSEDDDEFLLGLCRLAERWLTEAVFARFRDTAGERGLLNDYFDDEGVRRDLERLELGPVGAAKKSLGRLSQRSWYAVRQGLARVKDSFKGKPAPTPATAARATADAARERKGPIRQALPIASADSEDSVAGKAARAANKGKVPGYVARQEAARKAKFPVYEERMEATRKVAAGEVASMPVPAVSESAEAATQWDIAEQEDRAEGGQFDDLESVDAIRARIREQRKARKAVKANPLTLVAVGALVCAGVVVVPRTPLRDPAVAAQTAVAGSSASAGSAKAKPAEEPGAKPLQRMDGPLAARLLRRWQSVKAMALGGQHDLSGLPQILAGEMLQQWRERAEESLESGWHWNYELINVQVDKVSMRNNGAVATVDCTLEESAALFDGGKPDLTDSYKATYKARYVMEWFADAQAWKITSGVVLK